MTLDEAITELNSQGYLVHNLYQTNDSLWKASIRYVADGGWFPELGYGCTPGLALTDAMAKIISSEYGKLPKRKYTKAAPDAGEALIETLGIKPTQPAPIKRRV